MNTKSYFAGHVKKLLTINARSNSVPISRREFSTR
jgi:hypothetical protein